ncbi:MAG TPA: hypothetical protein VF317_12730 [Dermatophilaceae bacterium]|jgi:hypothetical protein
MLVENELDAYIGGFHLDALSSGLAAQRRRGHHPHRARRPQPESDSALGRASLSPEAARAFQDWLRARFIAVRTSIFMMPQKVPPHGQGILCSIGPPCEFIQNLGHLIEV